MKLLETDAEKKINNFDKKANNKLKEQISIFPSQLEGIGEEKNFKTSKSKLLRRDFLIWSAGIGDVFFIALALIAASLFCFHSPAIGWALNSHFIPKAYEGSIILGLIFYFTIFQRTGIYDVNRHFQFKDTFLAVLKTSTIWLFSFLVITFFLKLDPPISRAFVFLVFFDSLFFLSGWRFVWHQFFKEDVMASRLRERVLLIGWSQEAERLVKAIQSDPSHPYDIIGSLLLSKEPLQQARVPILGNYANAPWLLAKYRPDIVVLANLDPHVKEIISLANLCEREHIQFKIIPSYFQILVSGLHLEMISEVPILGVSRLPLDKLGNRLMKRTIDFIGGLIGLALSLPLIAIFGFLVYCESPGPIFYSQIRVGKKGDHFRIYKIRSMRPEAEKDGVGWTRENDDRCLKIGAFMRKWNIDELPQFLNVLMGEMSLVGPRPERPEHILNFKEEIPHYNARHTTLPGLSGWAQIHGLRGDTDIHERLKYDLHYLENWTIWLDFFIIATTFLKRKNAY